MNFYDKIKISKDQFNEDALTEADRLFENRKCYPDLPDTESIPVHNNATKKAVFLSLNNAKKHGAVFVVSREELTKKGIKLEQIGQIDQEISFHEKDNLQAGAHRYHICLDEKNEYMLEKRSNYDLPTWSKYYGRHWFLGDTKLDSVSLNALAILLTKEKFNRYKLTRGDCVEFTKEFGKRVAMYENNASEGQLTFLKDITASNPDGEILEYSSQHSEFWSRDNRSAGESAAVSYQSSFILARKAAAGNVEPIVDYNVHSFTNDFCAKENREKLREFYIYHQSSTIASHMGLAFQSKTDDFGFVLHLIIDNRQKENQHYRLCTRKLSTGELKQHYTLLSHFRMITNADSILAHAEKIRQKFGQYHLTKNNCQTFAKLFLNTLGIHIWFSPISDGLKNNRLRRMPLWMFFAFIGAYVLSLGCGVVGLYLAGNIGAYIGIVVGVGAIPLGALLTEERQFSIMSREKLFEDAKAMKNIEVVDCRSKTTKLIHSILGW